MILTVLGTLVLAGLAAFFAWDRHELCVALIEGALRRRRATDIRIKFDWSDFDRDTFTYDVEYTNANGRRQRNRCKVHVRMGATDDALYWTTPL